MVFSGRTILLRAALASVAALTIGADLFVLANRNEATPVAVDEVVRRYRSGSAEQPPEASPTPLASAMATDEEAATPSPTAAGSEQPTTGASAASAFTRPRAGVYEYATEGEEWISPIEDRHEYPSRSYATVRRKSGCSWEFRHEIIDEHEDVYRYCARPFLHLSHGTSSNVEFFGHPDGATYTCDPPVVIADSRDRAGAVREGTCRSEDSTARHRIQNRGRVSMTVGGRRVRALRLHAETTLTGRVEGTATVDMWLHPETGLSLKMERHVDTRAESDFGSVRYRENATFTLTSLRPRR